MLRSKASESWPYNGQLLLRMKILNGRIRVGYRRTNGSSNWPYRSNEGAREVSSAEASVLQRRVFSRAKCFIKGKFAELGCWVKSRDPTVQGRSGVGEAKAEESGLSCSKGAELSHQPVRVSRRAITIAKD